MSRRYLMPFALLLILILVACSGTTAPEVSLAETAGQTEMAEESQGADMMEEDMMDDDGHQDGMDSMDDDMGEEGHDDDMDQMAEEDDGDMVEESMDETMPATDLAAWQTIALANAATGEQFALADFQGKTVFVEPMATWCSNCRAQQGHVRQAKTQLGDDVVFIGLSLETNLPPGDLAAYAQDNGFDWTYAVMTEDLLAQLAEQFGRSITSAPSTPHFIIRPDGTFTNLATGIHSADEIVAEIQAEQG